MKFEIKKVKQNEEYILKNLLEFYQYDFNLFYEDDLKENGRFEFIEIEDYFKRDNWNAYFIKVNKKYAGFILINDDTQLCNNGINIEEFWIMPKYRKGYFCYRVLKHLFELYKCPKEFIILKENKRWLNVVNYLIRKNCILINEKDYEKWECKFKRFLIE